MKNKPAVISSITLALMASGARAAITIPDTRNFEGGVDGSPFNTALYNINSPSAVIEDDGTAQSPFTTSGAVNTSNTKGIILTNATASDAPATGAAFTGGTFDPNTTYYLQFDYKTIGNADNAGLFMNGTSGRAINIHMSSNGGDNVQVNQGSGFGNISGMTLTPDAWYRFTLTINPLIATNDSFDLRVQSLENTSLDVTAAGLGFQNDATNILDFRYHFNANASFSGSQYAIDNTIWTDDANDLNFGQIPEPGSLALLGLGGLCVLRRRRS